MLTCVKDYDVNIIKISIHSCNYQQIGNNKNTGDSALSGPYDKVISSWPN